MQCSSGRGGEPHHPFWRIQGLIHVKSIVFLKTLVSSPPPLFGRQVKFLPCDGDSNAFLLFCFSLNADSDGSIVEPLLIPESERGHVGLEVVSDNAW